MKRQKEIKCDRCEMQATPDRLDAGVTLEGEVVYLCPVCGNNLGEVTLEVDMRLERAKLRHPSSRGKQ